MASFGKAQLLKYGWSEGKGLGKHENGVVEAIKPKIKNNTAGIGFQDTQTTWIDDFMKGKKLDEFSQLYEENKSDSKKKHNSQKFLKSSTLENGILVECEENRHLFEATESAEIKVNNIQISDEELFKACGGRTLHKGARHSIGMSGKLARIQQAEENFLRKLKGESNDVPLKLDNDGKISKIKKKKKKKEKS